MPEKPSPLDDETQLNEAYVYFKLYWEGDLDPEEVAAWIGFGQASIARRGSRSEERMLPRQSSWEYSPPTVTGYSLDIYAMTGSLVATLHPYREKIRQAVDQWQLKARFQVVLHLASDEYSANLALGFGKDVIALVHEVGATVDIDAYNVSPHREGE